MGQIEPLFRARNADVGKTAFLLDLGIHIHALLPGKNALFKSRDKHNGEFQALRGVQGHQNNRVGIRIVVVDIRKKCNFFEVVAQRALGVFLGKAHKRCGKLV